MEHITREEWDACAAGDGETNPFLLHDFLAVLEESDSAVKEEGWLPQHVLVRRTDTGELLGCAPCYLKAHSYGEYVFDQSWGSAYQRMLRQPYYPKLLVGVPFTPVPGPRLLVKPGPHAAAVRRAMASSLQQIADQLGVSSLHINFCTRAEWEELGSQFGYLQRLGLQYHWYNTQDVTQSMLASMGGSLDSLDEGGVDAAPAAGGAPYSSFDGEDGSFLMALRQPKRKSIRQERKKAAQEGLRFLRLTGADLQAKHWDSFYRFYRNTTDRKWGSPYLTRDFFARLGERMADRVLLVLAETADGAPGEGKPIAGALNLIGSDALYGRNWGSIYGDRVPFLHFELCYYQALEFAIERGLKRVEAGAQGEHKIQRGYVPSLTYSLHYLPNAGFAGVVERFLDQERQEIEYTLRVLQQEASPYKI
ncbi:hypothetical protein C2E21_4042 [Chlorella sorokiniana]|uniref:GNAT family N-acetyltransferase n=1 Tax=Chlorella sorokiniana TaxID=3076 RepID=A0A2P6TSG7_CHLSO|nr:hypothetical protein C2E21_4042 [Chlorella sorokiniana]|eukprot:PRW57010.1 hypothetical protein C2E21_4042 [Chlorella sorokiniana]